MQRFKIFIFLSIFLLSCKTNKETISKSQEKKFSREEFLSVFHDAVKQKDLGNYPEAISLFDNCLKIDNSSSASMYGLAHIFFYLKDYAAAENMIKKAIEIEPNNFWYYVLMIDICLNYNKIPDAIKTYQFLIKKYPDKIDLSFDLASIYSNTKNYSQALETYNTIEEKIGISEETILAKTQLYFQLRKSDKILEEVSKLIEYFPNEIKYKVLLADTYLSINQKDEALKIYLSLIESNSDNGLVRLSLAKYYLSTGYFDEAYNQLIFVFQDPLVECQTKVQLLFSFFPPENTKHNKKTYQLIEFLVDTHSDEALSYATYAEYLLKDGNYKQAREQLLKVLSINKQSFEIWDQLLNTDIITRDFKTLITDCDEAITYFPNQPLLFYYQGLAYSNLNDFNRAIEKFNFGLDLIIDNDLLKAEFYSQLAEVYNSVKDYEKSDFFFDATLAINPMNLAILNNFSYYLSLRNTNIPKAKEMSRKVIQVEPLNPTYLDTYAWVLYKNNEFSEALKYIEMAVKYSITPDAVVIEHYGDILFRTNNLEKAIEQWKYADSIGKGSDVLKEKINKKILIE